MSMLYNAHNLFHASLSIPYNYLMICWSSAPLDSHYISSTVAIVVYVMLPECTWWLNVESITTEWYECTSVAYILPATCVFMWEVLLWVVSANETHSSDLTPWHCFSFISRIPSVTFCHLARLWSISYLNNNILDITECYFKVYVKRANFNGNSWKFGLLLILATALNSVQH